MTKPTALENARHKIAELEKQLDAQRQSEQARHRIMTRVAALSGQEYFDRLALELAENLAADITLVGKMSDRSNARISTLSLCSGQQLQDNIEYDLLGTPCADVISESICCYPEQVCSKFPADQLLIDLGIEAYVGVPLHGPDQEPLGIIACLYRKPIMNPQQVETTLQLTANLTAAEILRQREIAKRSKLEQANVSINKRLQEKGISLNQSQQTLGAIIETLPSPIFHKNNQGIYTGCNQAFCDYLGINREAIIGHSGYDIAPADLAEVYHQADLDLMRQHGAQTYQARVRYADGRDRDILFNKATIGDSADEILGLVGIMTDVTELNESKQFLTEIINTIADPVFVKDEQHRWQIVNDSFCDFVGISHDHLLGKSDYDFFPREQADNFWAKDQQVFDSGQEDISEEQLTVSPSQTRHLETKKTVFSKISGEKYLVGIIRDISAVRRTEQEMTELRNLLRNIIDSMPSALIAIDSQARISQWNQQAEAMTGLSAEQAIGQKVDKALPLISAEIALINLALSSHQTQKITKITPDQQGDKQFFEVLIYPLQAGETAGAVLRIDNVSERVKMEKMLVQSEKMLSLGGLAAGMAHEMNNPLGGILQNLQVLRTRLLSDIAANTELAAELGVDLITMRQFMEQRKIPEMLDMIAESGQRAAKIVRNVLSFSRNDSSELSPCDLELLIKETLELTKNDLTGSYDGRDLQITTQVAENLPPLLGVKSQLQQVLLSLLKNSAQAFFDCPQQNAEAEIKLSVTASSTQVTIEITDNGPGIEEHLRQRIFEPFFTTKDSSGGTGLGLSVAYYIITNTHKGTLTVDSGPGQGTCFTIGLPIRTPHPSYTI